MASVGDMEIRVSFDPDVQYQLYRTADALVMEALERGVKDAALRQLIVRLAGVLGAIKSKEQPMPTTNRGTPQSLPDDWHIDWKARAESAEREVKTRKGLLEAEQESRQEAQQVRSIWADYTEKAEARVKELETDRAEAVKFGQQWMRDCHESQRRVEELEAEDAKSFSMFAADNRRLTTENKALRQQKQQLNTERAAWETACRASEADRKRLDFCAEHFSQLYRTSGGKWACMMNGQSVFFADMIREVIDAAMQTDREAAK